MASVGARQGDRESANLNYWAYWVGEIPDTQLDDAFMGTCQPGSWHGRKLLHHIADRLDPALGYVDLYAYAL